MSGMKCPYPDRVCNDMHHDNSKCEHYVRVIDIIKKCVFEQDCCSINAQKINVTKNMINGHTQTEWEGLEDCEEMKSTTFSLPV